MTSEMNAYTMTDRATFLKMRDNLELEIVLEVKSDDVGGARIEIMKQE